jgi:hypothetical protein
MANEAKSAEPLSCDLARKSETKLLGAEGGNHTAADSAGS